MPRSPRSVLGLAWVLALGACAHPASTTRPRPPTSLERDADATWFRSVPPRPTSLLEPARPTATGAPSATPPPATVPTTEAVPSGPGPLRPALPAAPLGGPGATGPPPLPPAPAPQPGRTVHVAAPALPTTAVTAAAPPSAPAPAPAPTPYPTEFSAFVARLRADATSGRDPDLAGSADALEAIEHVGLDASPTTSIVRVPELEALARAPFGRGTGWSTITTWREEGGDADAIRAVYLDFDRVPEWLGKPGTRAVARSPTAVLGETDAVRRALAFEFGAAWRFLSRPLDRGGARLIATTMVPWDGTRHMMATHGIVVAFPEGAFVRVVEVMTTCVDFEVPALVRNLAEGTARKELYARNAGIRGHWKEYVGKK